MRGFSVPPDRRVLGKMPSINLPRIGQPRGVSHTMGLGPNLDVGEQQI